MLEFISTFNPMFSFIVGVIGALAGVFGVILAVVALKRSNYKSLSFDTREQNLFDSERVKDAEYKVLIKRDGGQLEGENLTRTFLLIYNNCNSMITAQDITKEIVVRIPDGNIFYDVELVIEDDESSNVILSEEGSELKVTVDQLAEKCGFILQIDHSSLVETINIHGTVKDDGLIKKMRGAKYKSLKLIPEAFTFVFLVLLTGYAFGSSDYKSVFDLTFIMAIIYVVLTILLKSEKLRNYFGRALVRSEAVERFYFRKLVELSERREFN